MTKSIVRGLTALTGLCVVILAGMLAAGCGPKTQRVLTCQELYQQGNSFLEEQEWVKAQQAFERITLNYPGCELVDDAQFMLGEVYFRQNRFIEAQFEYRRLAEDFRLSERMEDAQYMIARCSFEQSYGHALDQTITDQAIFSLRQYLEDFPGGHWEQQARESLLKCRQKLARKSYETARFYNRQGYGDAALIYVDNVLNQYPETGEWVERARFLKARILIERNRRQEALQLLTSINMEIIKPRMREDVTEYIRSLQ